jgi:hypothetical protein
MANLNLFSDLSSISQSVQEDAIFVIRETYVMPDLVQVFNDMQGSNPRIGYTYNQGTAGTIAEADDLTSHSFVPSADQTLTPIEIGLQFFISDQRADSSGYVPENVLTDAALELGYAAGDQIQTHLLQAMGSLTAGTIGAYGSALVWSHYSAAIAGARQANKSSSKPMTCVLHGYQWCKLAASASVAGAAATQAPQFADEMSRKGYVSEFMGVPFVQVYPGTPAVNGTAGTAWFTGAVFPKEALAIDWRRPIRVRAERDESRRGVELNMTAVYAYGLWRPARGYCIAGFATQPVV